MAKATQANRLLSIATPLGEDYLLINKVSVNEELSNLFEIHVELLYDEEENNQYQVTPLKINSILGQAVSLTMSQADKVKRIYTGMVRQIMQVGRDPQFAVYKAVIVPQVWKLTQNSQSRIFQHKRVPDILQEVFQGYNIKMQVQAEYKPRNYCVQYRETDFDFASRLMEEEGIYYYFEHTGEAEKLVLRDDFKNPEKCPNKYEIPMFDEDLIESQHWESAVKTLHANYSYHTGKVAVWDYNFQLPKKKLDAERESKFDISGNKDLEVYTFPAGYARKYDGIDKSGGDQAAVLNNVFPDIERTVQNRMLALDAQHKVLTGTSDCGSLTPGYRFQLRNHPNKDLNIQYIVVSVKHNVEQTPTYYSDEDTPDAYSNEFTCIPHGSGYPEYRPPQKTAKPIVHGSQTAFVVGPPGEEIFTDKYGRVKVKFNWDRAQDTDANSSCWVRVAQAWAGNRWGMVFIPRVGMEVIVEFLEGDPDQPIIRGCVYNPETMPPYTLPDEKTKMTIKSDSTKGGGGFNELRFEDKKGDEQIFVHGEKNLDVRIKNDRKEIIKNDSHLIVENNQHEKVKSDKHLIVGGDQNEKVDGAVSLKVGTSIQRKAGTKYAMDAGQEIHLKSGTTLTIETGTNLTLKVGGNFININSAGIFVKGTMVMLNSGGVAGTGSGSSPELPKEPKEADTANPGDKIKPVKPPPPLKPKKFGEQAQLMQSAAQDGTPFCAVCSCS